MRLRYFLYALVLPAAVSLLAPMAPAGAMTHAPAGSVTIVGQSTTWRLSLLQAQRLARVPHTTWIKRWTDGACLNRRALHHPLKSDPPTCVFQYDVLQRTPTTRFYVYRLALTNTGTHAADPYTDLILTMIVKPGYHTAYPAGWTLPDREPVFDAMERAAAQQFAGTLPWIATAPGHTTIYTALIIILRQESHYGLYNFIPNKKPVFLLDTGL